MDWLTPPILLILFLAVLVSLVAGRLRRESVRSIVLSAVGFPLSLAGLLWAGSLGTPAVSAAIAASLGSILYTMAASQPRPKTDPA